MFCLLFLVFSLGVVISAPAENLPVLGIVGGETAQQELLKYQVSLELKKVHFCGGTLIATNIVLTAAHCTQGIPPAFYQTRVGSSGRGTGGQVHQVQRIINHPSFTFDGLRYDIAVLKLAKHVTLGKNAGILPLTNVEPTVNTQAIVSGWGLTKENGNPSNELLVAKVPIMDRNYCRQRLQPFTEEMICAGRKEGGIDACQGDSGGPLVANNELVGIVSWGRGCARPGESGVYANVALLRPWIIKSMEDIRS